MSILTSLISLPHTVPPGGVALVRVDGRLVEPNPQGPGRLDPTPWQGKGRVDAILFAATRLRLRFDVTGLRSAEGVRLDLTVTLALHIADPVRFLIDVVRENFPFDEGALTTLLADLVRGGLRPAVARLTLEELATDPNLRGWLGEAVRQSLQEADLANRSGLVVEGLDTFDLSCEIWNEVQNAREQVYVKTTLERVEAEGRRLLDEALLEEASLRGAPRATPDEGPAPQEAAAPRPPSPAETLTKRLRMPPSILRPEIWRRRLGARVDCVPLYHSFVNAEGERHERIFVATHAGAVHAYDAGSGEPLWATPTTLPTVPGDGLALAGELLWVPGRNGVLYGLSPETGLIRQQIAVGGRLSSAPLAVEDRLYLSVDVDPDRLETLGQVVWIDPVRGKVHHRWQVSKRGIRAAPTLAGRSLYVGDRQSGFYKIDGRGDHVQSIPVRGGRILAAAAVDGQRKQIIVATLYGLVALALDGSERWVRNLGQAVVGRPCLHNDRIYAGAADGKLYSLDAATGIETAPPFETRGPIASPPQIWRHLLFVASNDGYLYAMDTRSGRKFWEYHSGSAITVPPALSEDGRLFVVDLAGHLSALRWCLHNYADGARQAEDDLRWVEACELWTLTEELDAAFNAAEQANRPDLVAQLATAMKLYDRAAESYTILAQRSSGARAAIHWRLAAESWILAREEGKAQRCRLQAAQSAGQPLIEMSAANLPALTQHQPTEIQVRLRNIGAARAANVTLLYSGHVQRADRLDLGSLDVSGERLVTVAVTPSQSGSALVNLSVAYTDARRHALPAAELSLRLHVAQPPQVNYNYYGPTITGDGVILIRAEGRGRQMGVQSDGERMVFGRGGGAHCPHCGESIAPGASHCDGCGKAIPINDNE